MMKSGFGLLAAVLVFAALPAQAAENIACMDGVLAGPHKPAFDKFNAGFTIDNWAEGGPPEELLALITERAGECAENHDWSPDAIEQAIFYMMGRITANALEAQPTFTPTQWQRLKNVYATADKTILRRVMQPMIDAELTAAEAPKPTKADELYFGRLLFKTGIPATEKNGELMGAWMASQTMLEMFSARFAKY